MRGNMENIQNVKKVWQAIDDIKKVIKGKDESLNKLMCTMLAGGHILMEDIPGVGKTTLALAFSKALSLKQKRMQFTPDVLPAAVEGVFKSLHARLVPIVDGGGAGEAATEASCWSIPSPKDTIVIYTSAEK